MYGSRVGLSGSHVGVFGLGRPVDCAVVFRVAVAQFGQGGLLFNGLAQIAVRAVGVGFQVHALAHSHILVAVPHFGPGILF